MILREDKRDGGGVLSLSGGKVSRGRRADLRWDLGHFTPSQEKVAVCVHRFGVGRWGREGMGTGV